MLNLKRKMESLSIGEVIEVGGVKITRLQDTKKGTPIYEVHGTGKKHRLKGVDNALGVLHKAHGIRG